MRILHFSNGRCSPDSANGVDKTVYFASEAQASLGQDVAVFSLTTKETIPVRGADTRGYAPDGRYRLPARLLADVRDWRPDIVHLHSAYVLPNVLLARRLRRWGVPYAVTPNGVLSPRLLRRHWYLKVPFRYGLEVPYLNRAAVVHAVSPAELEDLRYFHIGAPTVVAPNGIDLLRVPARRDGGLLEERFPATAGKRVFLFLGRLDIRQKGLDLLLDAWEHVREVRQSSVLVLVGPSWKDGLEVIERRIAQGDLGDSVVLTGPVYGAEKFDYLEAAHVFVHVSRWEGVPFAVNEALGCGKPCLVTPAADPLDLIGPAGAGERVEETVESVAAGLARLAGCSAEELSAAGASARRLAETELSWATIAATLVRAYRDHAA